MKELLKDLEWRYATKVFDPSKKLSDEQLDALFEAYRLTATSFGLQVGKLLVVDNPELRQKIEGLAWNQKQVTEASHLLVFAVRTGVEEADIVEHVENTARVRGVDPATLEGFAGFMRSAAKGMSPEKQLEWNSRQAYIALAYVMIACAKLRIDSCPMEGFNPKGVDELLGLEERGLHSVLLLPVGHRSDSDKYGHAAKVRKGRDVLIERI